MPDLHTLPKGWRPETAVRNNGPNSLALERWKLRELAEGWPSAFAPLATASAPANDGSVEVYRDSCEWENFESIFAPTAYIYTTWTGKTFYKDFFEMSKRGMDNGAFIMCLGATTDINPEATRAVTKMKATITQRFVIDGCEVDAEADCRFFYAWEKGTDKVTDIAKDEWRARYVRHWYEKDWLKPVNPARCPKLDESRLAKYPPGYRYLSYCQEETIPGLKVITDLPGHRREGDSPNGKAHDMLYMQAKQWVEGGDIDF